MPHIDVYGAAISPWTYFAGPRFDDIAARHGATVTWKPVDLIQLFPRTGGLPLPQRHDARKAYRLQELRRATVKTGLPFNVNPMFWPVNAAPSSYAIIAAQATGQGGIGALVHAFCRACWAEERDISDDDVVRDVLARQGFDPAIADRGMLMAAETYAANLEEAVSRGVFGAPFYIVDGAEKFWGQDRLDDLDLFLAGKL
ncbi:MAG TPA: 2-hydroxychromene-2-carboxylate isomerase [Paracoccaceae bacterium]|nr:2-hydroxychromene-2-carboxylate isomerase [Paracoccaceae bacterium]